MFFNISPYITWLGILLTSKPNALQNRLNILSQSSIATNPPTTVRPVTTTESFDFFICRGTAIGRYAHTMDCRKFYFCPGDRPIVRPSTCPDNLFFSPIALLCTIPAESGCTITGGGLTGTTVRSSTTTRIPSGSAWLRQVEALNYNRPVNEDNLVVYFDHGVTNSQNIMWPITFTRNVWTRILDMYGDFGPQNRLHIIFRSPPLSEDLNFSSYLDSQRGLINAIEVGSSDWSVENATNTDLIMRNVAQVVITSARGTRYPGPEPSWSDIFVYDFYNRINRTADRDRWEAQVRRNAESNIESISIFSQWYLPIYTRNGGGSVLNRFLIVREQNFPKATGDNSTFNRRMNRGEFIHFWSFAIGQNLTDMARTVFGWSDDLSAMYQSAVMDFSNLRY